MKDNSKYFHTSRLEGNMFLKENHLLPKVYIYANCVIPSCKQNLSTFVSSMEQLSITNNFANQSFLISSNH